MDAHTLLRKDHREVLAKLQALMKTSKTAVKTRARLLDEVAEMIDVHAQIEEELYYPRVERAAVGDHDRELIVEAREEHAHARAALAACRSARAGVEFTARCKVLHDLLLHHIEEEERNIFPRARRLLGMEELKEIGDRLMVRKEELMGALA